MNCCAGGMWMMWLWAIVLVVLVIGGVVAARAFWNRSGSDRRPSYGGHSGALEVLEKRYARGEIDREEFERRRESLSQDSLTGA